MSLLTAVLLAASDTLLVEVRLVSTDQRILVEAVTTADSSIHLPSDPVYRLLGLGTPERATITAKELQAAYPTTRVVWAPLELRLYVFDPLDVLPASRKAKAEIVARTQHAFSVPVQSGPFLALAVDDSLRTLLDVGYSYRGRVAVAGRVDDSRAGSWGLTLAPSRRLFLSYQDAVSSPPLVSGRIAAGPLWLSASYMPDTPVDASGLLRVGAVSLFASRQYGVVTINRSSHLTVQFAHQWEKDRTSAARVSVGPSWASPFAFPVTSLTPRR